MTERRRLLRVLVVEGQPLYRDLLADLVDHQSDMRAAGVCGSTAAALDTIDRTIDVALVGPRLPDGGGIALGHALRARSPRLGIIVICAPDGTHHAQELRSVHTAGWGVLSKNLSLTASALVYAIRSVADGRSVLDPAIRAEHDNRRHSAVSRLSARQREVLSLVADGLSNTAIARRLALSPRSVEAHLRASYAVLGLGSDPERNARVDAARSYLAHVAPEGPASVGEIPLI